LNRKPRNIPGFTVYVSLILMNKIIYCISGLGTDEKIFTNLQLEGCKLKHIPWLAPHKKETLEHYARRMAASIQERNAILMGVSFGGMIGIEIARQMPLQKLILVSSIKSAAEMPRWMKIAGKIKLNKLIRHRNYKFTERINNYRLGASTLQEKLMARAYRQSADRDYVNWSIDQILNWKNTWMPENILHIHGDKDKVFPVKKISNTRIIKGGTHFMVYNRATDISKLLKEELAR